MRRRFGCAWLLAGLWLSGQGVAQTLLVGMEESNNKPYEYVDSQVHLTGFHVELVREVAARLGWQVTFRRMPWKRALRSLETGDLDAVTYVARSSEREQFAIFLPDNVLHVSYTTLYIQRKMADKIHYQPPLEQMVYRWRTGIPGGYYMSDELMAMLKRGAPVDQPTLTQSQLFVMLLSDRFDMVFGATSALELAKAEIPDIERKIQRLEGALFSDQRMYIAFSRQLGPMLPRTFAEGYRQFRDEPAYQALIGRFGVADAMPQATDFR